MKIFRFIFSAFVILKEQRKKKESVTLG